MDSIRAARPRAMQHGIWPGFAFAAICFSWGSTFLALGLAVQTIPPLTTAGARAFLAGLVLYAFARFRGAPRPALLGWRNALASGTLLFAGSQGAMAWAEQRIPSGTAAIVLATMPVWVTLAAWLLSVGPRPNVATCGGMGLGMAGVTLLAGPSLQGEFSHLDVAGLAASLASAAAWGVGTSLSLRLAASTCSFLTAAMQLLTGGGIALFLGACSGDWSTLAQSGASWTSVVGLTYLVVVGSLIAFGLYACLLEVWEPARVTMYGYLSPVIALYLGWAALGEPVTSRSGLAVIIILSGVSLTMWSTRVR